MDEIKDLLECISKFDKTETFENKGKYFDTIQKDAGRLVKLYNLHSVSNNEVELCDHCDSKIAIHWLCNDCFQKAKEQGA